MVEMNCNCYINEFLVLGKRRLNIWIRTWKIVMRIAVYPISAVTFVVGGGCTCCITARVAPLMSITFGRQHVVSVQHHRSIGILIRVIIVVGRSRR
jgi:uncharacterized protein (UPF0548 family)